jgi:hypothetical protein
MRRLLVVLGFAALAGCGTQEVPIESAPALDIPSNYADKVSGTWVLAIDDAPLAKDIMFPGEACARTDFPIDLKASFDRSVIDTFRPLVEDVRPGDAAGAAHTSGVIRVTVTDFRVRTRDVSGILVHTMESVMELDLTLEVDGPNGKLLETQATGTAKSQGNAGFICEAGSPILAIAARNAMTDALTPIATAFANSRTVRNAANMP